MTFKLPVKITVTSWTSFIQIAETRSELEKANRSATTTELDLRKELETQRQHMEEEMAALSLQHSKRLEEMIEQHKEELRKLEGIKDEEIKVLFEIWEKSHHFWKIWYFTCTILSFRVKECESKLQKSHRDEITSQLQANKLMIDAVKSQAEQKRVKDIEELTIQHENEQGWS